MKTFKKYIIESFDNFINSDLFEYTDCYPNIYNDNLYEGLIKSYKHELLIKKLKDEFENDIININIINTNDENNSFEITFKPEFFNGTVTKYESKYEIGPLKRILDLYGYYISTKRDNTLYIEPSFSKEITNQIYKIGKVYHITSKSRANNIIKNGLNAKEGNKNRWYSHRVYIIFEKDKNILLKEVERIIKDRKIFRPVLLEIDLSKNNNTNFYIDPNCGRNCAYTYNSFNPKSISIYKEFYS